MAIDWLQNLKDTRDNYSVQLAEISADPLKPSYIIDGQSMQWTAAIDSLQKRILDLTNIINGQEPYELQTIGVT